MPVAETQCPLLVLAQAAIRRVSRNGLSLLLDRQGTCQYAPAHGLSQHGSAFAECLTISRQSTRVLSP